MYKDRFKHLFLFIATAIPLLSYVTAYADFCGYSSYNYYDSYDYGGVSLNKTAELMLNLEDISGAVFDEATGQVILYGKNNVSLPQMKLDDLSVAIRSVFGYGGTSPQDPGVSIGTEPSPIPGQMKVRYDGQTYNTEFGYTMFESDRLLKSLTLGKDNVTGQAMTSTVPGFLSLIDRYRLAGRSSLPSSNTMTRMWFVPKEISLVQSEDNASMVFSNTSMQLLTESKYNNNITGDVVAEAFASHFTLNYDAFAAERPILGELKRLGKITAVVKWIKDNNIPFDLSYFENYTPAYDSRTPMYTPSTTVTRQWWESGVFTTFTMTGGVQYLLDASNFSTTQGVAADEAQQAALTARTAEGSFSWDFLSQNESYQAVAHSLSRSRKDGNIKRSEIDMMFPVRGNNPLIMFRFYNSFNDKAAGFGLGWDPSPYKLRFPTPKQLFTFGSLSISVSLHYQIFVTEKGREYQYTLAGLDANLMPVYLCEGSKDVLKEVQGGGFVLNKINQGTVTFDSEGKFTRITDTKGISINYTYDGSKLVAITHQDGKSITINYSGDRISSVVGPGGSTVSYYYNAANDLWKMTNQENETVEYNYDSDRRLNNVIDPRSNRVFNASLDDYNRATSQTVGSSTTYGSSFDLATRTSTVTAPTSASPTSTITYTQVYDADYRLTNLSDNKNRQISISYDGEFGPSAVTDAKGNTTEYKYDAAGNVIYLGVTNSAKTRTTVQRFLYDTNNNLVLKRDGNGYDTAYVYDEQNKPKEIRHVVAAETAADGSLTGSYTYAPAYVTVYTYDANGNLQVLTDADNRAQNYAYEYDEGLQKTVTVTTGVTNATSSYDTRGRLSAKTDNGGGSVAYSYDGADRVTVITTPAGTTRNVYDFNGNLEYVYDPNALDISVPGATPGTASHRGGTVTFTYNTQKSPTHYVFNANNKIETVTDANAAVTTYLYDTSTNTRLAQITLPGGSVKILTYNDLDQVQNERTEISAAAAEKVVVDTVVNMGSVEPDTSTTQSVTVCNSGQAALTITSIVSSNQNFTVSPASLSIPAQQCVELTVTFTGTAMGTQTGTLTLYFSDGSYSTITLSAEIIISLNASVRSASNGIQASWNQYGNSTLFAQYRIYRSTSPITTLSGLSPIATLSTISAISYTDTTAIIGSTYYYCVAAFDGSSNILTNIESVGPINFLNIGKVGQYIDISSAVNSEAPAIAFNSNASYQNYLVVYEYDTSGAGTNWDIYGQRISADGQKIGSAFPIMTGAYSEKNPRLAYNSTDNEYLVVAEYDSDGAGLYQVVRQRVSADGALIGSETTLASSATAQRFPDIAYNSQANNYLVAFQADFTGDGFDDFLQLIVNSSGEFEEGHYNNGSVHFRRPRVEYNPTANEYLAAVEYTDSASSYSYVAGMRIASDGSPINSLFCVYCSSSYKSTYPDVVYNGNNNEYVVTWQYDYNGTGSSYAAALRKVFSDGTIGSQIQYYTLTGGGSFLRPGIIYLSALNEYLVSYTSQSTANEYNVVASRLSQGALTLVTTLSPYIAYESSRIERHADMAYNAANGQFMAAYEYVNGSDMDVRAQRMGNYSDNLIISPQTLDYGATTTSITFTTTEINSNGISLSIVGRPAWLSLGGISFFNGTTTMILNASRANLGVGTYSGYFSFMYNYHLIQIPATITVVNSAPLSPSNPVPLSNGIAQLNIGSSITTSLGWTCSDANFGDTLTYDVYFSSTQSLVTNADPSALIATGITSRSAVSPAIRYGTTYYWRIKSTDSHGATTLGAVWSFTTPNVPAPVPVAYAPSPTKNTNPTLTWNSVAGISRYHIQIAGNSGFSPLVAENNNVVSLSYTPAESLPAGDIYWRVAAIDDQGIQGAYGASQFAIDLAAPAAPAPTINVSSRTTNNRPTIQWSAVADAAKYHVQISTDSGFQTLHTNTYVVTGFYLPQADLVDGTYYFRVSSVDLPGNESAFSPMLSTAIDTIGPPQVSGLSAVFNEGSVRLAWTRLAATEDFDHFNIYRSTAPFSNVSMLVPLSQSIVNPDTVVSYDSTPTGGTYYYAITGVDTLGNENKAVIAAGPVVVSGMQATVSPTSIAENYQGVVSLGIANLPSPGTQVLVEQLVDANGNVVADAGDYVIRRFMVSDGGVPANSNIAADADGAVNGAITAALPFFRTNDLYHAPGTYLIRVSKGTDSITTPFTVSQVAQAQTLFGTVSDGTSPVPGALVQLVDKWQRPYTFAIADSSGGYLINVDQPGDYYLQPMNYGFTAPVTPVSLAANAHVETALVLNAGTYHVTGEVKDSATGEAIPGVWIMAKGTADTGIAISSDTGSFDLMLPAGQYSVTTAVGTFGPAVFSKGYAEFGNQPVNIAVSGDMVMQNISLPAGTIASSGRLTDAAGNPVMGMPVQGKIQGTTDSREPESFSVSDETGNYAIGLFESTNWDIALHNDIAQQRGYIGTVRRGISTVAGPLAGQNLTLYPITAWIQGTVRDSSAQLVPGVPVHVRNSDSTVTAIGTTANDGTYRLGTYAGSWFVGAQTEARGMSAIPEQGVTLTDSQTATVNFVVDPSSLKLTVTPVTTPTNVASQTMSGTREAGATIALTANTSASIGTVTYPTATTWSCSVTGLAEGSNRITVTATDTGLNTTSIVQTIILDTTPPVISLSSPAAGDVYGLTPKLIFGLSEGTATVKVDDVPVNKVSGDSLDTLSLGQHTVRIDATDMVGNMNYAQTAFTIYDQVSMTSSTSMPTGIINNPYSFTHNAAGGTTPYAWSVASGSLPAGLSIDSSTGLVTGTPTVAGTSYFSVKVEDASGSAATRSYSVEIMQPLNLRIVDKSSYLAVQSAYDAAVDGDVIQIQAKTFTENVTAYKNATITLGGGYSSDYVDNSAATIIQGTLVIEKGAVIIDNLQLR